MQFFLNDIAESLLAACLFPIFVVLPGYIVAKALDIWQFQERSVSIRFASALALSITLTPGLAYLVARFSSLRFACALFVTAALFFLLRAGHTVKLSESRHFLVSWKASRSVRWGTWIILAWIAIVILLLSDLQLGTHLYPNVVSYDYTMRIAVTGSIARTDVPPANPYFHPGHPVTLYYYYFWFMTCSLVDILGGQWIGPRAATIAGTAWVGLGMLAIAALFLEVFQPYSKSLNSGSIFIVLALFLVSGLDIVPIAGKYVYHHFLHDQVLVYWTVEWWNEQITAWQTAILWVPHHVAGLIATLTTFLLFTHLCTVQKASTQWLICLICSVALLSAVGLSIWVTLAFVVFWMVWIVISYRKGWHREARFGIAIGVLALGLSIPYLFDLHTAKLADVSQITIAVRPFFPIHHLLERQQVDALLIQLADFVALPVNYFIELGVFAVTGVLYWKHRLGSKEALNRQELALLALALSATVIASFVRSSIYNNDLGWRSAMFMQFIGLIWSIPVFQAWAHKLLGLSSQGIHINRGMSLVLSLALALGALGPIYDVVMMKLFPMWGDLKLPGERRSGFLDEADLGRRYYDLRETYEWVAIQFPESAIVQHNPDVSIDLPSGLYGNRQVAVGDHLYATLFAIPVEMYQPIFFAVSPLFESNTIEREDVSRVCQHLRIDALVVNDKDPIWKFPDSWIFRNAPVFANRSSRVFECKSFRPLAKHPIHDD